MQVGVLWDLFKDNKTATLCSAKVLYLTVIRKWFKLELNLAKQYTQVNSLTHKIGQTRTFLMAEVVALLKYSSNVEAALVFHYTDCGH